MRGCHRPDKTVGDMIIKCSVIYPKSDPGTECGHEKWWNSNTVWSLVNICQQCINFLVWTNPPGNVKC